MLFTGGETPLLWSPKHVHDSEVKNRQVLEDAMFDTGPRGSDSETAIQQVAGPARWPPILKGIGKIFSIPFRLVGVVAGIALILVAKAVSLVGGGLAGLHAGLLIGAIPVKRFIDKQIGVMDTEKPRMSAGTEYIC